MFKIKKLALPLALDFLIIAVAALFFAFYRLPEHYGFEFDQERDYNVVRDIVINKNFTLIGPRVVSSAGFFLGPYYYYLNIPFFVLFQGEPVFAAYFTGLINIAVTFLIYFFLKKETKSRLLSLATALFWISGANKSSWNVSFVPLVYLSFLYLFTSLLDKWRFRYLVLLTLVFSFSLHFHVQMIFLAPLWFFAVFRHKLTSRQSLLLTLSFLVSFMPLLAFDLRHNFINFNALTRFITSPSAASVETSPFRLLYSLRQFSTGLEPLHPIFKHNLALTSLFLLSLSLFVFFSRRYLFLLIVIFLSIFTLAFYREPTWPEYYHFLAGLSALLLLAIFAARLKIVKYALLVLLVWGLYRNLFFTLDYTNPGSYANKKRLVLYMLEKNQPYEKLNIDNDFRFGEGLGFSPIREFYESREGAYHPSLRFYVSYADSPKHNSTLKTFGLYGVSLVESKEIQK